MMSVPTFADDVAEFATAFDQLPTHPSQLVPEETLKLAAVLILEEVRAEFFPAFTAFCEHQTLENRVAMVDGAIDSIYVILWAMHMFGVPVNDCWREVQRSNMAKLNADGTYTKNENGKVQKPASWTPPDLFSILMEASSTVRYEGGVAK